MIIYIISNINSIIINNYSILIMNLFNTYDHIITTIYNELYNNIIYIYI